MVGTCDQRAAFVVAVVFAVLKHPQVFQELVGVKQS